MDYDVVSPKSKKSSFLYPLDGYKKRYPRTYVVRLKLLQDNRIKENQVTPKTDNWILRALYKSLIGEGYGFGKKIKK